MAIIFNPAITSKNDTFFAKKAKKPMFDENLPKQLSRDELVIKNTKKAISDAVKIVLGVCVLYFAVKRNLKVGARVDTEIKKAELLKKPIMKV